MDLDDLLDLPVHLRDAFAKVDSAGLDLQPTTGLVVAGMGGSAVGGLLARAILGDRERRPIVLVRDYTLPSWIDGSWTVLLSSYSGGTEETIAAWDAVPEDAQRVAVTTGGVLGERAMEAGIPVIPLPGGFQPRAAVGYATVAAAEVAAACGAAPSLRDEVLAAADAIEAAADDLQAQARELAWAIGDELPLVIGAGASAAVAYRWKTQINENANRAAFANELPEHDHNEIEGWGAPVAGIFLRDAEVHERVAKRFDITARMAAQEGSAVHEVALEGASRAERVLRGVMLGDLVSFFLAENDGTDPAAIPVLDALKAAL
jgi:glucose/mannose-6-phosphate isomerase